MKGTLCANSPVITRDTKHLFYVKRNKSGLAVMKVTAGKGNINRTKSLVVQTSIEPIQGKLYFIGKDGKIRYSQLKNQRR